MRRHAYDTELDVLVARKGEPIDQRESHVSQESPTIVGSLHEHCCENGASIPYDCGQYQGHDAHLLHSKLNIQCIQRMSHAPKELLIQSPHAKARIRQHHNGAAGKRCRRGTVGATTAATFLVPQRRQEDSCNDKGESHRLFSVQCFNAKERRQAGAGHGFGGLDGFHKGCRCSVKGQVREPKANGKEQCCLN